MTSSNPIEQSFELAAACCDDLTPHVYQRLFREHPEAHALFRSQGSDLIKGSMLALAIEALLDFAGERSGHFRLIECEMASHDGFGTSQEVFVDFFRVVRGALRDLLGSEWSAEIDGAWDKLLADIAASLNVPA